MRTQCTRPGFLGMIILSMFFLASSSLRAQVDTTFYPPLDTVDPFPLSPYAILSPYKEKGSIQVFATAKFASQTRVFIRLKRGAPDQNYEVEVDGTNLKFPFSLTPTGDMETYITLPPDKQARIVSWVGVDKSDVFVFNTFPGSREVFEASAPLIERLAKWKTENAGVNLVSYLQAASDVHWVEKMDFIQFHFFKDQLLPDAYLNQFPSPDTNFPRDGRGEDCICSFVVRATEDVYPGIKQGGDIYPVYGGTGKIDEGDWEHWREWSFEGLPRFYQQFSQGKDNATRTAEGGISYFRLEQIYLCSNFPNRLPEGCDCEVPVHYSYQYASVLDAQAKIRSCFLCGDREAETKVDDIVFAFFSDDQDRYHGLGGGAASSWAKDSKPQAKIAKLILPVASITLNLIGIASTKGIKLVVSGAKLAADVAKVVQVLTTPGKTPKDEADYQVLDALNDTIINIYPNIRAEFVVASMTAHAFDNKKRFFTWNRVLSGGYAQAIIKGGPLGNNNEKPECCVPSMTHYAQATFTSRYPTANILDHLNDNVNLLLGSSFPDINNQVGLKWMSASNCNVGVDRSIRDDVDVTVTPYSILINEELNQPFQFAVFDVTGKILKWGEKNNNLIELADIGLAPGLYFVRIFNGEIDTTVRYFHN